MKDTASVGVGLRQIYSSGRRSHHPNDAPRPINLKSNYRAEERVPLPPAAVAVAEGREGQRPGRWRLEERTRLPNRLVVAAARVGKPKISNLDSIDAEYAAILYLYVSINKGVLLVRYY